MKNELIISGLLVLSIACAKGPKPKTAEVEQKEVTSVVLPNQQASESEIRNQKPMQVKGMSAVFYSPDSIEIEKLKSKVGEDNFYQIVDDNNYYNSEAMKELEKNGIKVVVTDNRYIEFLKDDGRTSLIDKVSLEEKWGVILFDGKKEPLSVSPVDIASDIKKYFDK